jgi:hypothetical protein
LLQLLRPPHARANQRLMSVLWGSLARCVTSDDTAPVEFRIVGFERVCIGITRAFVNVVIVIDEIEIIVSGWQIIKEKSGYSR